MVSSRHYILIMFMKREVGQMIHMLVSAMYFLRKIAYQKTSCPYKYDLARVEVEMVFNLFMVESKEGKVAV